MLRWWWWRFKIVYCSKSLCSPSDRRWRRPFQLAVHVSSARGGSGGGRGSSTYAGTTRRDPVVRDLSLGNVADSGWSTHRNEGDLTVVDLFQELI
ncbi:hypothetical protein BHE74_00011081 [Ensete ventricosum]|nr:hypothetical protein GW17_00029808 [Ensete ventricosum]RWW80569.1 hypothetical protein BHE74_00011081 [Ensete ventricosum]